MGKLWRIITVVSVFAAATFIVSTLNADSTHDKGTSMMGEGGMMNRMGQMRGMMEGCSRMMSMRGSHSERPNDRWRKPAPTVPEKKS